ncbi:M16 family metallopeptidase [Qipengyuania sp.]|uniref:M16 family metallopeptidase n=1 Tax=Qipengyuania sp. TaxID=2004515 RepID=UPI0035C7BB36
MKLARYFAAAALLAVAAPLAAQEAVPFEQFTLDNGLKVVVHEDHSTPKVAIAVWYRVGAMNEPEGRSGFAHLYEHLMFNGSEHRDDEWFPALQEIGASAVNGATSLDQTYYFEIVPTGGLERALWLESDRMGYMRGATTQAKLDEQRAVVKNEKRTYENRPYGRAANWQMAALFPPGHPYHDSVIGSMEDLDAASLEDVRSWFAQYYGASNAVISLSGDITAERARELVQKYFGEIAPGPPTERVNRWVPELSADRRDTMLDNVPQSAVSRAWVVPGRSTPDTADLRMAAYVLGRGKNSRLYRKLVHEKGIATGASANYQSMAIAGVFEVDAYLKDGVDPAVAEAAMNEVVADYMANGPTAEEIARAKTTSFADNTRAFESIYVRAMALADGLIFANDPALYAISEREFAAVTKEQAAIAARKWLGKPSYQLNVLPFGQYKASAAKADRTSMPPDGQSPDLTMPVMETATLSNGITVKLARRTAVPLVEMAMVFDAGSAAEDSARRGVLGFMSSVMDYGQGNVDAIRFAERQANLGARIGATGNADETTFFLSSTTRNLKESVNLWADYVMHPAFRAADIEKHRIDALSGLSQSLSSPDSIAQRTFQYALYGPDHAYGTNIAGREQAIRSIGRDDLVAFHQKWIRPDNATVFAAGDTTIEELTRLLEASIGTWEAPPVPSGKKAIGDAPRPAASRVILVDRPGSIQSVIRVGQTMPSALHKGDFILSAMNDVLGGGFNARLNMNLREDKGWTYGANSYLSGSLGPQSLTLATSIQTDRTAEALKEIRNEIAGLVNDHPATNKELELIRNGEVLALPGRLETNGAVVSYLQHINRLGLPYEWLSGLPAEYAALSPGSIADVTKQYLAVDSMTWVIVGDLEKIETGVRALELGELEVWNAEGKRLR